MTCERNLENEREVAFAALQKKGFVSSKTIRRLTSSVESFGVTDVILAFWLSHELGIERGRSYFEGYWDIPKSAEFRIHVTIVVIWNLDFQVLVRLVGDIQY